MAARAADHDGETDIVQRALAILDEEVRAWLASRGLPARDEEPASPGDPAEPEGTDGR